MTDDSAITRYPTPEDHLRQLIGMNKRRLKNRYLIALIHEAARECAMPSEGDARPSAEVTQWNDRVARDDLDDRHCDECGDLLATDADHGWVCLTCNEPREGPVRD